MQSHQLVVDADRRAAGRQAQHAIAAFGLPRANQIVQSSRGRRAGLARVGKHAAGNVFEFGVFGDGRRLEHRREKAEFRMQSAECRMKRSARYEIRSVLYFSFCTLHFSFCNSLSNPNQLSRPHRLRLLLAQPQRIGGQLPAENRRRLPTIQRSYHFLDLGDKPSGRIGRT